MCGLFSVIGWEPIDPIAIGDIFDLLRHRGPDGRGWLSWDPDTATIMRGTDDAVVAGHAVLAHTRLAVIDTHARGLQPMTSTDGRYHIVYNGEVYNYRELAEELRQEGWSFHTETDTEVVLAALATWKWRAVQRFIGMFALVFLDTSTGEVIVSRDPFGIKPLFYQRSRKAVAFASEMSALLRWAGPSPRVNSQALFDYLCFGLTDHSGSTLVDGIHQFPPAHILRLRLEDPASWELRRYWSWRVDGDLDVDFREAVNHVRELFMRNVEWHLRSDVAVGAAVSGGIDSSSIVCAIRYLRPTAQISTFSYISSDKSRSEHKWVREVNACIGASEHLVQVGPEDLMRDFDELLSRQGEPFGSTSIYAQYAVFRAARKAGITVMLDGQGADELLAGYYPYQGFRLASLLSTGRLGQAVELIRAQRSWEGRRLPIVLAVALAELGPLGLKRWLAELRGKRRGAAMFQAEWLRREIHCYTGQAVVDLGKRRLAGALKRSIEETLPYLLRYEDRNSMAFSIESRVPFLTADFAEYVLNLPESYLVSQEGRSKHVFREAMRGIVPDSILARKDKIGFETPQATWLADMLAYVKSRKTLLSQHADVINPSVTSMLGQHSRHWGAKQTWRVLNFLAAWDSLCDTSRGREASSIVSR